MSDVVRIELGMSIFEAELIGAQARSANLRAQVIRNEYAETGGHMSLGNCAILVAVEHEPDVRAIIADFYDD